MKKQTGWLVVILWVWFSFIMGIKIPGLDKGSYLIILRAASGQAKEQFRYTMDASKLAAPQNAKLTNGLMGLWSFDDPDMNGTLAYDRSGQGNNGRLMNGPTRVSGKIGQALSFDGVDNLVAIPANDVLDIGTHDETFSLWFKPNSTTMQTRMLLKGNPFNPNGQGYTLSYRGDNPGKPLSLELNDGGTGTASQVNAGDLTDTWHHVVVVLQRGVGTIFYLDGTVLGRSTASNGTSGTINSTHDLYISHEPGMQEGRMNGLIDDVRIYNRALTAQEVTHLYVIGASESTTSSTTSGSTTERSRRKR